MTEIIVSISLYLVAAILLGFTFGWFIAKGMLKEKYNEQLEILSNLQDSNDVENLKEELNASNVSNQELMVAKNALALEYELKHATLEKEMLSTKHMKKSMGVQEEGADDLAIKFQNLEEKYLKLKQQHEKEIDAFLEERVDITRKYKELLEKMKTLENLEDKPSLEKKSSWFGRSS